MRKFALLLFAVIFHQAHAQFFPPMGAPQPVDLVVKPELRWKFQAGGPVVGSPVIDNGTVYVGALDSALYAIDLNTGKVNWKLATRGTIRSSVCIVQQRLFLLNSAGLLYMIQKDSGQVLGFFQTTNGYFGDPPRDFADYFQSTPVVADSLIFFGSGEDIYAININDGYQKWRVQTGGAVHTKPAVHRNRLYAGSFDGHLYAIDIASGNVVWKFKTTGNGMFPKGEVTGNPVVAGGTVFAGARDFNLYAVETKGGYCNWMKTFEKGWCLPVTVNDSVIYAGTSDDRTLFAFNIRSGREVWKADAGFNVFGGMALANTTGYFGTLAGKVHGIDLHTGMVRWTIELDGYKNNRLSWLKKDDTYRDDIDKFIKAPGDVLRMYRQLGGVFGTPATDGNDLVVAGYDGWIYCFTGEAKQ